MSVKFELKKLIESKNKQKFSQSPKKWLESNGFSEYTYLIGRTSEQTRINIFTFVYGEGVCKHCNSQHQRLQGWKKWSETCSEKCENEIHSKRQKGTNNSVHKMTQETKEKMRNKQSSTMKNKILKGEFTPKSENYKSFGMMEFRFNGEIRKVRSSWEYVYWISNPHLEYEKIRIEYFDSQRKDIRVYIADFFDSNTNTIIEIKPSRYQNLNYQEKKQAALNSGYSFITIDEQAIKKYKNSHTLQLIKESAIDFMKIEKRFTWMSKAK